MKGITLHHTELEQGHMPGREWDNLNIWLVSLSFGRLWSEETS